MTKHDPSGWTPRRRAWLRLAAPVALAASMLGAASPALANPNAVHVTVTGDRTDLNRITGRSFAYASGTYGSATANGVSWGTVCMAPCERTVDPSGEYVVGRHPMTFSRRLRLEGQGPDVEVHVQRPGRLGLRLLGAVLTGAGAAMLIAGPAMMAAGTNRGMRRTGTILLGVGIPVTGLGITALVFGRAKAVVRPRR